MMRTFLVSIGGICLFCVSMVLAEEEIRVAAWNIETLGSPYSRDYPARRSSHGWGVARKPADVAAEIKKLKADVVALTEIDDTGQGDGEHTNSILDAAFQKLNETPGHDWKYVLFAKRQRDSERQHTGLAWNEKRVTAVKRQLRIAVSDVTTSKFAEWDRHPHAMKFTRGDGRTDFVVIPIHMKAGSGEEDREQREQEALSLVAELDEIAAHFSDKDIILIGDFNMHSRNESAGVAYRRKGELFDLNYFDRPTHITGWSLDRCYIPSSQRAKEFQGVTEVEVVAPTTDQHKQKFRKELSDHWPIVLEFAEQQDDD